MNIFDPINGPAFKPSPLKPTPWFMQGRIDLELRPKHGKPWNYYPFHQLPSRQPVFDANLRVPSPRSRPKSPRSTTPIHDRPMSPASNRQLRSPSPDEGQGENDADTRPLAFTRKTRIIKEEPLQRPSSRLTRHHQGSEGHGSVYSTPPEYVDRPLTPSRIPDLFTLRTDSPVVSQLASQLHQLIHPNPSPRSFEYIDLHSPRTSPSRTRQASPLSWRTANSQARASSSSSSLELHDRSRGSRQESRVQSVGAELKRLLIGRGG